MFYLFYIFSFLAILFAIIVITSKNPVYAVLSLIAMFLNGSGLFILIGNEFIAAVLVIVYVGAIAVLFLFVVMMLDIDYSVLYQGFVKNYLSSIAVGIILLANICLVIYASYIDRSSANTDYGVLIQKLTNTEAIGHILYTDYFYAFQITGIILLTAMVGTITLTLRKKSHVKRQKLFTQLTRSSTITLKKVPIGEGIEWK